MRQDQRPTASTWHPILAARERKPGLWVMAAQDGSEYGTIRFVRRGPEVGYRADAENGETVGYYLTLKAACEALHRRDVDRRKPGLWSAYGNVPPRYSQTP